MTVDRARLKAARSSQVSLSYCSRLQLAQMAAQALELRTGAAFPDMLCTPCHHKQLALAAEEAGDAGRTISPLSAAEKYMPRGRRYSLW